MFDIDLIPLSKVILELVLLTKYTRLNFILSKNAVRPGNFQFTKKVNESASKKVQKVF